MKKVLQITILLLLSFSANSQNDLGWKTILNEQFNNNYKGWHTESCDLRYAQISNGQLIDRFSNKGFSQSNRVSVNFNTNKDHIISFSIANLNGDASKKYRVYEKRKNGTLKDTWENNTKWGFVWGFKDWDNYNCIIFYNNREYNSYASGNYLYNTLIKIVYNSLPIFIFFIILMINLNKYYFIFFKEMSIY